jgi:hypothetical protein
MSKACHYAMNETKMGVGMKKVTLEKCACYYPKDNNLE